MGEAVMMEKKGESWPPAGSSSDFQSFQIEIATLVRAFYARGRVPVCGADVVAVCEDLVGFSQEEDRW